LRDLQIYIFVTLVFQFLSLFTLFFGAGHTLQWAAFLHKMAADRHAPKNLLITGGCGFIGSNFINYIFDRWTDARFVFSGDENFLIARFQNNQH
jgi:hypothetical protein